MYVSFNNIDRKRFLFIYNLIVHKCARHVKRLLHVKVRLGSVQIEVLIYIYTYIYIRSLELLVFWVEPFFFSSFSFFNRPDNSCISRRRFILFSMLILFHTYSVYVAETYTKRFHATDHDYYYYHHHFFVLSLSTIQVFFLFCRRRKNVLSSLVTLTVHSLILFFHPHHPFSSIEHHDIYKRCWTICMCVCI